MNSELLVSAAPFFLPITLAAAVYIFLFWHPRRRDESHRRYFGPLFRSGNPWVAIQALFAGLWIAGAVALAIAFRHLGRPILEGLALATAAPAAFGLAAFFLALSLLRRSPDRTSSPGVVGAVSGGRDRPPPEAMQHLMRKGRIRFYVLLGMVILETALLPVYGTSAMIGAIGVAVVVMLTLHKLYDY
ncbi:MAG: hypothetical protein GIW97_00450 [Candidatus Eremiobacteraeota bacterium]|nr:hypothetical protein [Candidatus Eremiobacteraeota bacterium]